VRARALSPNLPDTLLKPAEVRESSLHLEKFITTLKKLAKTKRQDMAILRLEQLYPLGQEALRAALSIYATATPVIWCRRSRKNMGAWRYLRVQFGEKLFSNFLFRGFPAGLGRPRDRFREQPQKK